jgi:2,3-bisphosphoglycerate-independent phosphoglycerate mutase
MSAPGVTSNLLSILEKPKYHFCVANFANADMVGHTGNLAAAQAAVEEIDADLGQIVPHGANLGWYTIITADHGNVEEMVDPISGSINPEHTKNPVPFIIIPPAGQPKLNLRPAGTLADIAPTILEIFGLPKPAGMTGESLIIHNS